MCVAWLHTRPTHLLWEYLINALSKNTDDLVSSGRHWLLEYLINAQSKNTDDRPGATGAQKLRISKTQN